MKILVVGSGGREHAIVWKLAQDSSHPELFCAPGNAGTAELAHNIPVGADDLEGLLRWAQENRPDLTVVGPEAPLCAGIVDLFTAAGLKIFGPSRAAAQLEGSKVFSKEIMISAGVPTAQAKVFDDITAALDYVLQTSPPLVVKADGLAAGKGVVVCLNRAEAETAVRLIMEQRAFGKAGRRILVEEYLTGEEASVLAFVDGQEAVMLASAQDYKRVYDHDKGPNTGGMGAYSPTPVIPERLWPSIREQIFERTLNELRRRNIKYKGVLYAGLMITAKGPKVLEFNCRFGDPETQVILPRLKSDLLPVLLACVDGGLKNVSLAWRPDHCVCVVMASGGYPSTHATGKRITGLDRAKAQKDVIVFHAGTKLLNGTVVTAGGRVLGVTALGKDLPSAIEKAYAAVSLIHFENAHYRRDIAMRALGKK
ncbi:MAG: phosphoribosylamine--glycine ligase [Kiritimatiellia bacterium]